MTSTPPDPNPPVDSVLFVGFGGPTAPDEIMPFLRNVVFGRGVPDERLKAVEHHYLEGGGSSPYNAQTAAQRDRLGRWLSDHGRALPVYVGMRNWSPFLKDTIATMNRDGRRHAIGVILAGFRSEASWDRYQGDVACAIAGNEGVGPHITWLDAWFAEPRFHEANAQEIERASGYRRGQWPADVPIVFTAHSIPTAMADASPYVSDLRTACEGVARILGAADWELAWQSRSGDPRTPWLEPDINEVSRRRAKAGTQKLVAQAIGFLSDHVEVLFDLDIEARATAAESGIELTRAACVHDHPEFITMLGERIVERLAEPAAGDVRTHDS